MPKIDANTKHIVCYSGGHSSALVAVAVAERYGTDNLVLLNHDINASVEDADIKRFKREVAEMVGLRVTQANHAHFDTMDQFDIAIAAKAFKVGVRNVICTHRLKTEPFMKWLKVNVPDKNCVIYYGFDVGEKARIQRRSGILGGQGYQTDYPLALWATKPRILAQGKDGLVALRLGVGPRQRSVASTRELGIEPPLTYGVWKHANCIGCTKAKRQHWYCVYVERPDIFAKAKHAEDVIGHSIMPDVYLDELEEMFADMRAAGVPVTEHIAYQRFWADAKKSVKAYRAKAATGATCVVDAGEGNEKPCECVF